MRHALILLLVLLAACAPGQFKIQPPTETDLKELPVYKNADYLAVVEGRGFKLCGFLIEHDGKYFVITAGHIIDGLGPRTTCRTRFKNDPEKFFSVELVGYDRAYDTAVLAVKEQSFQFGGRLAVLGDSDTTTVGDLVYSLGNPRTLLWYISEGLIMSVSARDMNAEPSLLRKKIACRMIEHSAMAGYGSSGGPVLNSRGEVIAMNVEIVPIHKDAGISEDVLAIPINEIKKRLSDLMAGYKN